MSGKGMTPALVLWFVARLADYIDKSLRRFARNKGFRI